MPAVARAVTQLPDVGGIAGRYVVGGWMGQEVKLDAEAREPAC